MSTINGAFRVVITFDVTVNGQSNIYSQVTKLLDAYGFVKETPSGNELPANLYTGIKVSSIKKNSAGNLDISAIKKVSDGICDDVIKLIGDFFGDKKVDHKIFVHVSREGTSATKLLS